MFEKIMVKVLNAAIYVLVLVLVVWGIAAGLRAIAGVLA